MGWTRGFKPLLALLCEGGDFSDEVGDDVPLFPEPDAKPSKLSCRQALDFLHLVWQAEGNVWMIA